MWDALLAGLGSGLTAFSGANNHTASTSVTDQIALSNAQAQQAQALADAKAKRTTNLLIVGGVVVVVVGVVLYFVFRKKPEEKKQS